MPKDLLFDKEQIIALMHTAFGRLRKLDVHVMDVVNALRTRHPQMTRARFDDQFMIRPERDCTATVAFVADLVQVMYGFSAQVWSADELLQLLIALRVPVNQIAQYGVYFWGDAWANALQKHATGLYVANTASTLVGREEILQQIRSDVLQRRHVVLSGEAGIGKTTLAMELARIYELQHAQHVYYLDMQRITSLSGLHQHIADVFQIRPMGNEPLLLRLKMVLDQRQWYLMLDGLDAMAEVLPTVWLSHLLRNFPTLRYIITTRETDLADVLPDCVHVNVPSLPCDGMQSAAPVLFMRVYRQAGGRIDNSMQVIEMCRGVNGNPLMVSMLANAMAGSKSALVATDPIEHMLYGLAPTELRLVTLVVLLQRPVSVQFLRMIVPQMTDYTDASLRETLTELTRRGVLIALDAQEQYAVHMVIRQVWQQRIPQQEQHQLLRAVTQVILDIDHSWEDDAPRMRRYVMPGTVGMVVHIVDVLLEYGLHDLAIAILVQWHTLWLRHGLTLEAIELCERCIVLYPDDHPQTMELNYVLGSLYAVRGAVNLALVYLNKARDFALEHNDHYLWARIAVERGMVGLYAVQDVHGELFVELSQDVVTAMNYFAEIKRTPWQSRAADMIAYMYFSVGDVRQALEYNDLALKLFRTQGITLGLLDASWNRGLILMAIGDFAAARSYLLQAHQEYAEMGLFINAAHCNLRLAAIAVLSGEVDEGLSTITAAFEVLYRVGGMQDLLYIIDIYSGYLMHRQRVHDTLVLVELSQRFRAERGISRGIMLDQVMEQQVALAQRMASQIPFTDTMFHANMTFYEVMLQMRTHLQVAG